MYIWNLDNTIDSLDKWREEEDGMCTVQVMWD